MQTFTIGLARTCLVQVEAGNLDDALRAVSNFIGNVDESLDSDRDELGFKITSIEIVDNDAFAAS